MKLTAAVVMQEIDLRHGYTTYRVTIDIEGLPGVRMAHLAYYRDADSYLNALNADYAPVALPDSARAPIEALALATLREHYPAAVTK